MKKTILMLSMISPVVVMAQSPSAELTCRAQAKEVALQAYSNCMTTARNQQVDDIRKNYKKELQAVKAKYEGELKKLSQAGKAQTPPAKSTTPEVITETSVDSTKDSAQNLIGDEIIEVRSQVNE